MREICSNIARSEPVYLALLIEINILHSLRSCKMKLLSLVRDKRVQNKLTMLELINPYDQ